MVKLFSKPPATFFASYVSNRGFKVHKQKNHAMLAMNLRNDWYKSYPAHSNTHGESVYEWTNDRWDLIFFQGGTDFSVPFDLGDGKVLTNVHPFRYCEGALCPIHNPICKLPAGWKFNWRADSEVMERLCTHGIGHPDPSQYHFWIANNTMYKSVHGCDGCCQLGS